MEAERRNSERITVEMPVTFDFGKNTFFGTTANVCDNGMMIESSLGPENVRRIFKALLKTNEYPIAVNYSIKGKLFSRPGKIKHYHLDFSGGKSASHFSIGVWVPKLMMRNQKGL
ncbi:MAG: PilZ domain-containing protein [Syntrophobacterales bacterium]|nr:MAG: PilZ domain-containing protein [Syntrophobacterales bacterium]